MSAPGYAWRNLTPQERETVLAFRKAERRPWHSPPHWNDDERTRFHITAACFEHVSLIGRTPQRMDAFTDELLGLFEDAAEEVYAWCVLPNHYHALIETPNIAGVLKDIGRFHGRTSYVWNGEERTRGRQVFRGCIERGMRSDRHYWTTLNYVHHNPVHHGYAEQWTDWPWSSARNFLEQTDPTEAKRIWKEYPLRDYGKGWDDAHL